MEGEILTEIVEDKITRVGAVILNLIAILIIIALSVTLTWVAKDIVDPCPAVECSREIRMEGTLNDVPGDFVIENCEGARFYPEARKP